jgi:copper chaperone NosL
MITKRMTALLVFLSLAFWCTALTAAECEIKTGKKDRCPVCGMFVSPYPNWVAAIKFNDGSMNYFDGPKDLFKYLFFMEKYNKEKTRKDVTNVYVTEFYSTQVMAIDELYFVSGSDVMGPMGRELIPVQGEENARTFLKDHGGDKIIRFNDIGPDDIPQGKM